MQTGDSNDVASHFEASKATSWRRRQLARSRAIAIAYSNICRSALDAFQFCREACKQADNDKILIAQLSLSGARLVVVLVGGAFGALIIIGAVVGRN